MVICNVPRAGLGNQLFPLMKAYTYAYLNNEQVLVSGYHQIRLGAYLRGEKSKRKYTGYFVFQKNVIGEAIDRYRITRCKKEPLLFEPSLQAATGNITRSSAIYSEIPGWDDFFAGLREHRLLVKKLLWDLLAPGIRRKAQEMTPPCIGVHIRMGDFRKLKANEDFKKVGQVRTPEPYFIDVIEKIRRVNGKQLPVTIFTDGHRHEFEQILKLNNVQISEGNPDIVDMLLLSRSDIIVTSAGSTFSYWSGFLSDVPIIMHPDHIHEPIRSKMESNLYEGPMDIGDVRLTEAISKIKVLNAC